MDLLDWISLIPFVGVAIFIGVFFRNRHLLRKYRVENEKILSENSNIREQLSLLAKELSVFKAEQKKHEKKVNSGLDYERYIGYLFEKNDFKVTYNGCIKGLNDWGIDLICEDTFARADDDHGKTYIVQCKHFNSDRSVHENVVCQLIGSTIAYYVKVFRKNGTWTSFIRDLDRQTIIPVIFTSSTLSDTAKEFARIFKVKYYENKKLESYPKIKLVCHIQTGDSLYLSPDHPLYDRVGFFNHDTYHLIQYVRNPYD